MKDSEWCTCVGSTPMNPACPIHGKRGEAAVETTNVEDTVAEPREDGRGDLAHEGLTAVSESTVQRGNDLPREGGDEEERIDQAFLDGGEQIAEQFDGVSGALRTAQAQLQEARGLLERVLDCLPKLNDEQVSTRVDIDQFLNREGGDEDDREGDTKPIPDVAEPRSGKGLDNMVTAERVIWTEMDNAARTRRVDPKRSEAAAILVMDSVIRAIAAKSLERSPITPGPSDQQCACVPNKQTGAVDSDGCPEHTKTGGSPSDQPASDVVERLREYKEARPELIHDVISEIERLEERVEEWRARTVSANHRTAKAHRRLNYFGLKGPGSGELSHDLLVACNDGLRSCIEKHGSITLEWIGSASKRITSLVRGVIAKHHIATEALEEKP